MAGWMINSNLTAYHGPDGVSKARGPRFRTYLTLAADLPLLPAVLTEAAELHKTPNICSQEGIDTRDSWRSRSACSDISGKEDFAAFTPCFHTMEKRMRHILITPGAGSRFTYV